MFSPMDIGILAGVALLVFGPKRFPELGASLGKGIGNFKKAMTDVSDEVQTAIKTEPVQPTGAHPPKFSSAPVAIAEAQPAPTLAQTAASPTPPDDKAHSTPG
jgi:sec-independent protein translocase protein TatA